MTDLYEALRAAVTPDGRVRLTRELLTAMHEEGERRSRVDDDEIVRALSFGMCSPKRHAEVGCDTCDAKNAAIASVRSLRERAETAERERDNLLAIIHRDGGHHTGEHGVSQSVADAHATWAAVVRERDAATERAEKAERERDEARARIEAAGNVVSDNGCDCACDHSTLHEDHDEDCEVCVVCRVADALWPEAGR
ncbi:MAG: hypothetical protein IPK80_02445 [Nannocystis sp.]|nr:hypothetical protein [Nannocystis sp.]